MKREEIIQCGDKKVLIDYIKKNSKIQVFEQMDIELLKNIALNIPVIQQQSQPQPQEQPQPQQSEQPQKQEQPQQNK